mmetsp:Transcript_18841/g.71772  ORF Transcript_18841/g.71772 Transcript_18841/m.71772 type:complete len:206 (+) Transcript_18841:123-740(+)
MRRDGLGCEPRERPGGRSCPRPARSHRPGARIRAKRAPTARRSEHAAFGPEVSSAAEVGSSRVVGRRVQRVRVGVESGRIRIVCSSVVGVLSSPVVVVAVVISTAGTADIVAVIAIAIVVVVVVVAVVIVIVVVNQCIGSVIHVVVVVVVASRCTTPHGSGSTRLGQLEALRCLFLAPLAVKQLLLPGRLRREHGLLLALRLLLG